MKQIPCSVSAVLLALISFGQNIINSEWIDVPFGVYNNAYPGGSS